MPIIRRRHADTSAAAEEKILTRPALEEPGTFGRTWTAGDFVILDWDTAYGTVGWAHSLTMATPPARRLATAVYGQLRDRAPGMYAALVLPRAALNLDLAPGLEAIDLHPGGRTSKPYEVTWRQLAARAGHPAAVVPSRAARPGHDQRVETRRPARDHPGEPCRTTGPGAARACRRRARRVTRRGRVPVAGPARAPPGSSRAAGPGGPTSPGPRPTS